MEKSIGGAEGKQASNWQEQLKGPVSDAFLCFHSRILGFFEQVLTSVVEILVLGFNR